MYTEADCHRHQIVMLGVAPLFWNAIIAKYGRYHMLLYSVLGSMVCNIGGARCVTFGGQMATRVLMASIISPPLGIGSGVVTDLCSPDKSAQKLGWWTLMVVLGTPAGPFIMGFVVQHIGVQWIFWIFVILNFLQAVAYLLLGEETIYIDRGSEGPGNSLCSGFFHFLLPRRIDARPFKIRDFASPFSLARYPKVLVPTLITAICFCYGNIVFIVEMPISSGEKFHFNAQQTGLQFIAVIIGAVIGEQLSGPMSDYFVRTINKRKGHGCPADRLWLSYIGFVTIIAGLLTWGFQLQKARSWNVTPGVGVAIASFGNQVQTTILIAYAVDNYREQSAAIGVLVNFTRLIKGFVGRECY
jgi:MFS family permease